MRNSHLLFVQFVALGAVCAGAFGGDAQRNGSADCLIRVPARDMARLNEIDEGALQRTDYGAFSTLTLQRSDVTRLRAFGVRFIERPNAFRLRIGGQDFEPGITKPTLAPGWDHRPARGSSLHLIQFEGPTLATWLDDIELDGLQVVQHIPPFSYLVWGDDNALARAGRRTSVRWTGPFVNGYKVAKAARNLDANPIEIGVLLCRAADTGAIVKALQQLGGKNVRRRKLTERLELVGVVLPGSSIRDVSLLAGVISVQPVPTDGGARGELSSQVNVNNVDGSNRGAPGYLAWLQALGLSGQGVTVGSVDTGAQETHPDLSGRFLSCTGTTCATAGSQDDHGTLTAGIIAGTGASGVVDSEGLLRGLGVSPGANLVEQLFSPTSGQTDGLITLVQESFSNGATLSNNSWGSSRIARGYDLATLQVDIAVRDADPVTAGNQQFTYVLAIENGEGGVSTQGAPDEAKNCLTIGSTKLRTSGGAQDLNLDDLSQNTAHGPARDGRKIPHMVAPGCSVDGPTINGYALGCGTSFAAPQVTGAIALFIERWRGLPETNGDPTPAMIKGAFLGAARSLEGHWDADGEFGGGVRMGHPPDSKQGWGRMDAEAVLDPAAAVLYIDDPILFDNTGQEWAIDVTPADPAQPMRLMLVWTDAPGHGLGGDMPAWNNDLDLVVEVDEAVYLGNNFGVNGWSQVGGTADFMNNTEGVFLGPAAPASITVRVVAANINSDGVPNVGDTTDQDFALVCYNCVSQPDFALNTSSVPVNICVGQNAPFTVDSVSLLGFSDPIDLSVSGEPVGSVAAFSVNPVTPGSSSALTISNTASVAPGSYTVTIDGVASPIARSATVVLNVFDVVPTPPATNFPTHRSNNIVLWPLFTWEARAGATTYEIKVARDDEFLSPVVTSSVAGLTTNSFKVINQLEPNKTYYWRIKPSNACGEGVFSPIARFTTRATPRILVVDDDGNDPDLFPTYQDMLGNVSQAFHVRDLTTEQEPNASTLAQYDAVIWYTGGSETGPPGPSAAGDAALASYLDGGGCLLLSSQDYEWLRGDFTFSHAYLGASAIEPFFVGHNALSGTGLAFAGLGPIPLAFSFGVSNFTNIVTPDSTAVVVFNGQSEPAAIAKDTGVYRSTYWAFPLAAVASDQDRLLMLNTFLEWCHQPLYSQHPDFIDCISGPDGVPAPTGTTIEECERLFDDDDDRDLDLKDYAKLQRSLVVTGQ